MSRPSNNFDFVRLLLASLVLLGHSCALAENPWNSQYVVYMAAGSVSVFFTISGFLICQSVQRADSLRTYFQNRLLRLYPGLIVLLLLTALFIPFVYHNPDVRLLDNQMFLHFIPKNLTLFHQQMVIAGVFGSNPYPYFIDGSLWTLPYEATCYMLFALLFFIRRKTRVIRYLLLGLFLLVFFLNSLFGFGIFSEKAFLDIQLSRLLQLSMYFTLGAALAVWNMPGILRKVCLVLPFLLFVTAQIFGMQLALSTWIILSGSIALLLFGQMSSRGIRDLSGRIGDPSYGIYIYGFVVQQGIQHFFHLNVLPLIAVCFPITFLCGFLSWRYVEAPALRLKSAAVRKMSLSFITSGIPENGPFQR